MEQGHRIKVSAHLWEEENNKDFAKSLECIEVIEYPYIGGRNPHTTLKGMFDDVIDYCPINSEDSDYYIILRPDLLYKSPNLHLDLNKEFEILLPHREYEIHWITPEELEIVFML